MAINRFSSILALLLCALPLQAQTFDAGTSARVTDAGTLTWSHTVAVQNNRFLAVSCSIIGSLTSTATATGITYAGSATGEALVDSDGTADGDNSHVVVRRIIAPATGANNIVATFDVTDGYTACGSESWYGVHQTTPTGTPSSRTSGVTDETSSSLSPASVAGRPVIDAIGWRYGGQGTITVGADQTESFTANDADNACCGLKGSRETAVGGTTTMSWSWATGGWTQSTGVAFALNPPAGGAVYHYNQQTNGR